MLLIIIGLAIAAAFRGWKGWAALPVFFYLGLYGILIALGGDADITGVAELWLNIGAAAVLVYMIVDKR